MKPFEVAYLCLEPFLPVVHHRVRSELRKAVQSFSRNPNCLDVGGRKSHYTIGVSAEIMIMDLPRQTDLQTELNLRINLSMVNKMQNRRSNVSRIVFGDMTRAPLKDCIFDCVVAVEVLEHVEQDTLFIQEVQRVLKPRGLFLMTTPNGDFIKNNNPDHKRHYTALALSEILSLYFPNVSVEYSVRSGTFHRLGLRSWSLLHPLLTVVGMVSNLINHIKSLPAGLKSQSQGTCHLLATARKED